MNKEQKECLYFYLNIKDIHEKRLKHVRDLVYSYYIQRVEYKEKTDHGRLEPCSLCGNMIENNIVYNESEGMRICNGEDNQGCGNVLNENELMPPIYSTTEMIIPYFSTMYYFKSTMNKDGGLSRYNKKVERNLSKYMSMNLTTSDHYKNRQRKQVYVLLDQIRESKIFDSWTLEKVRECFNQYRTVMTRIHNLKCVLFVLFELCLNNSL